MPGQKLGSLKSSQRYDALPEDKEQRFVEVQTFLGNNCLGWFEGSSKTKEALTEFLYRLPYDAALEILCSPNILVIDGSSSAAWAWRPNEEMHKRWLRIIVLRRKLREMPYKAVVGEIAHEFAHVVLHHDEEADFTIDVDAAEAEHSAQDEANDLARRWGFGEEIEALENEPMDI